MRLGVLATHVPYQQHTAPIWAAIGEAERERYCTTRSQTKGADPTVWLAASSRDFVALNGPRVMMEHGTGLQFYPPHELNLLAGATLIAAPNEFVAEMYRSTVTKRARIEIVGTPKMDALLEIPPGDAVAVSMHWTHRGGLYRFMDAFVKLGHDRKVIGHAHPRIWRIAEVAYREAGIEPVQDFAEVVRRAEVYCCDHSSTLYEWAALGRPIVLLDRGDARTPNGSGLRYKAHAEIGPTATAHDELADVVEAARDPWWGDARAAATADLYPFLGESTPRLLDLLRSV